VKKNVVLLLNLLMLTFLFQTAVYADVPSPQWLEFCPYKYQNAQNKQDIKYNPLIKPTAFVAQVCTLNLVPFYWNIQKSEKEVVTNNYWVNRKLQFDNEISLCAQSENTDNKVMCYMNVRQIEQGKNAQFQNAQIAEENLKLQKLRTIQQIETNNNLYNINNSLNGMRYGY